MLSAFGSMLLRRDHPDWLPFPCQGKSLSYWRANSYCLAGYTHFGDRIWAEKPVLSYLQL